MMSWRHGSSYPSKGTRRHRKRWIRKAALLLLVLGLLCLFMSVLIFLVSFLYLTATQSRMQVLSLVFVVAGIAMLAARGVLRLFQDKTPSRRPGAAPVPPPAAAVEPATGRPPVARPNEGMALVLVLILLALIVSLVAETQITARAALRREQAACAQARLRQAATDAARHALTRIAGDQDLSVDSTNDAWAAPQDLKDPTGVTMTIKITDENRRFDLNNVALSSLYRGARPPAEVAMDIMTLCGDFAPVGRIDALTRWLASGSTCASATNAPLLAVSEPETGAGAVSYLRTWSELLCVDGFDRDQFLRHERRSSTDLFNADLVDCLTVVPGQRSQLFPVNVNTAGREVLLGILGLSQEEIVRAILSRRTDGPVQSLDIFFAKADTALLQGVRPYLDVKSSVFAIEVHAFLEDRTQDLRVLARRDREGSLEVLQWVFL